MSQEILGHGDSKSVGSCTDGSDDSFIDYLKTGGVVNSSVEAITTETHHFNCIYGDDGDDPFSRDCEAEFEPDLQNRMKL